MVNSDKIKERMSTLGLKQEYIAWEMKISQPTLNLKINGKRDLSIDEMFQLADVLKIDPAELESYFSV